MLMVSGTLLLLAGAGFDVWLSSRALPNGLRFVPPSAEAFVLTGPLADLWTKSAHHPLFLESMANAYSLGPSVGNALSQLKEHCLSIDGQADLESYGINTHEGMSLSLIGNGPDDYVVAVPVNDRGKVEVFFNSFLADSRNFILKATGQQHPPVKGVRIDTNMSRAVRFCSRSHFSQITLEAGSVFQTDSKGELRLIVAPDGTSRSAEFQLTCSVKFADDTWGPCGCTLTNSKGETEGDCSTTLAMPLQTTGNLILEGRHIPGVSFGQVNNVEPVLAFLPGATCIFALKRKAAAAAMQINQNWTFHRGDDSIRSAYLLAVGSGNLDAAMLFGGVRIALPPVSGVAHFSLRLSDNTMSGRLLLPWQAAHSTVFENILRPNPRKAVTSTQPLSDTAEIRINDRAFGQYLDYLKYFPNAKQAVTDALGNFYTFIDGIADLEETGEFRGALLGVRNGAPDFLMSLEIPADKAGEIIFEQRKRFRVARDKEILSAAIKKVAVDETDYQLDLNRLIEYELSLSTTDKDFLQYGILTDGMTAIVLPRREEKQSFERTRYPNSVAQLDLCPEVGDLWNRYKINTNKASFFIVAPEYQPNDFDNAAYVVQANGTHFLYVSPPFTCNDVEYRLSKDDEDLVDVEALKGNHFRIAAYYDEHQSRLIIGSDIDPLMRYAAGSRAWGETGKSSSSDKAKLAIKLNPASLVGIGLNYPNQVVRDEADKFADSMRRYSRAELSVFPQPEENVLLVTMLMTND